MVGRPSNRSGGNTAWLARPRTTAWIGVGGVVMTALVAGLALTDDVVVAQSGRGRQELVERLTGKPVHVDAATRRVRPITEREAGELIDRIATLTAQATTPDAVPLPGAGSMISLSDHGVGHVLVSRPSADGTFAIRCVTSPEEAVAFLADEGADALPDR